MENASEKQPSVEANTEILSSPIAVSVPKIKSEPTPEPWQFKENENVNLLSDDEDDPMDIFNDKRPISANETKTMHSSHAVGAHKPKPDHKMVQEMKKLMLAKQKQMANKFRTNMPAPTATVATHGEIREDGAAPVAGLSSRVAEKTPDLDPDAVKFAEIKKAYKRQQKAGTASMEDDVAFLKAENAESARLHKRKADDAYDNRLADDEEYDDNSLFLPESTPCHSESNMASVEGKALKSRKRGRKQGLDVSNDDTDKPKSKRRKRQGSSVRQSADPDGITKTTSTGKSRKAKSTKQKKYETSMTNTRSIFGTNVFEDTAAVEHLKSQPKTGQERGSRSIALRKLVASVPTESKKAASIDRKALNDAIADFKGHGSLSSAGDDTWKLKGMKSTLKHYQVLGAGFMRQIEQATDRRLEKAANGDDVDSGPSGGILADQMGLGKTVEMLANIVNGRAERKARPRATLIIASPAIAQQWYDEILKHCEIATENPIHGLKGIVQHRAGNRSQSEDPKGLFEGSDVVLTTYTEVCQSYPKAKIPANLVTAAQKDAWWREYYEENRGLLHECKWLRVVLDEAQAIKNHKSHTSMACRALVARHYWAITGTPIQNTLTEFYPYFKFIREDFTGSFKQFKANFVSPDDPSGLEKLNVLLRRIMVRRGHDDQLFGARLLDLPKPRQVTLYLEFNVVERQIYEVIKKRFIARINTISKQNGLQNQYGNIWTMILRLRQLCSHLLLVLPSCLGLLEREDFEKLNALTQAEHEVDGEGEASLVRLRQILEMNGNPQGDAETQLGKNITEVEIRHTDIVDAENTAVETGGKHGINFRFRKYLQSMLSHESWAAVVQRTLCCGCRQDPDTPHVTSCYHIFCYGCLVDLQHAAARKGQDQSRCSECGEAYTSVEPCEGLETFQTRDNCINYGNEESTKGIQQGKAMDWIAMPGEMLPSAKTRAIKAQLLNWWNEDPEVKVIIYTQFLDMIRILGSVCKTEGWGYECYTGKMSHGSRAKSLEAFRAKTDKRLLLASLQCGGLGLNLTAASKVILIDAWWNNSVEEQAFCRVFRIGQDRTTVMLRLVVKNSMDEALMAIKKRKQKEIDEVMELKGKLNPLELLRLFGEVGEDEEGHPFIFPDRNQIGTENSRLANLDDDDEDQPMGNEA